MFLFFGIFEPRCSYKIVLIKEKECIEEKAVKALEISIRKFVSHNNSSFVDVSVLNREPSKDTALSLH